MLPRITKVILALPIALGTAGAAATGVAAHVVQTYGPYTIAIGWLHEPTYAGELNAVQLIVKDAKGRPVDDLTSDELHVQISATGVTGSTLDFEPSYDPDTGLGTPGEYDAAVIPTVPGNYTFKLSADLHGTTIDHAFSSGPTTFDTVHDPGAVEFPSRLPTTSEVVSRIGRDSDRLQSALAGAHTASDAAGRATALAIAGLVVGVVGAGLAVVITVRARRSAPGS
jgi:hypothetical protein